MFDATLLDSSPARTPILTARHWLAALGVGVMGALAGFVIVPMISDASPKALVIEAALLGVGVMFYELMIWYVLTDARHLGLDLGKWSVALLLLNVVGFVAYLIYSAAKTGEWKRATLPLAYIFQAVLVCTMLLLPLVKTQALPDAHRWADFFIPPAPAGPPPATASTHVRAVRRTTANTAFTEPFKIPNRIPMIREEPDASPLAPSSFNYVPGGVGDGKGNGMVPFGLGTANPPIPEPPSPTKPTRKTEPLHVGGNVEEAKLIFRPNPVYPAIAIAAHIEGTVELQAIISKDGLVQELKSKSGHPVLIRAAMEAVRQWRYQPTLLNGEPVEVVTEVQVRFILNE